MKVFMLQWGSKKAYYKEARQVGSGEKWGSKAFQGGKRAWGRACSTNHSIH